jgi:hypothetical protein
MRTLLFLLAFLIPSFSNAQEALKWRELRDGSVDFWVMHSEEGLIYIEQFQRLSNRLQTRVASHAYSSQAKAEAAFKHFTVGYSTVRPAEALRRGPVTEVPGQDIWTTQNAWSLDWEQKFADWVQSSTGKDFFQTYKVATDCADVAISLRWIFARMNGLPAGDQLVGTGLLFTNESMRDEWKDLPAAANWYEDKRFLAALDYVLVNTFTHTMMGDLYPTEITPTGIRSGTILLHLYNGQTGHTEVVHLVGPDQPNAITMMASDVPRDVRELHEYGIQDWGYQPVVGRDGFLHFRWVEKQNDGSLQLRDPAKMPLYSLEQYDPHFVDGFDNFTDAVIHKAVPDFSLDPNAALGARTSELLDRLGQRVKIVEDGFAACSVAPGCAEGSPGWESWSTPSRDDAIGRLNKVIWGLYLQNNCDYNCKYQLDNHRDDKLTAINGKDYLLSDALNAWWDKTYSSDPNQTIPVRWGLKN